jgi:hypothetical protein
LRLGASVTTAAAIAIAFGAAAQSPSGDITPAVRAVLTRDLKFSSADLADLRRGRIVKHSLDAHGAGEVAVVGAVRVNRPERAFLDHVRDVVQFKSGPEVLQIGTFSDPPVAGDLARLTVDKTDVNLRSCRVGDCDIRLPADVIRRAQQEINWRDPEADGQAAALFREVLLNNVRAYRFGSAAGRITEYDDDARPVRPVDDFAALVRNSPYLAALAPALPDHLIAFPSKPAVGAEDLLYWSKEKFGLTPFITVTHLTILPIGPRTYVTTSRDVYSTRYIDASLALTISTGALDTPETSYLIYVNRSRANALKGAFSGLRRTIVERRAKNSLDENLRRTKERLERQ